MTAYETVYSAFLSKILEDEWDDWDAEDDAKQDWKQIMDAALPRFKFPRHSLAAAADGEHFEDDLTNEEIQIIATYMKCEWLNRCVMTWENVKPMYVERDFSQANLIDKLNALLTAERSNALSLEAIYYRSRSGKPFDFSKLATRLDE